MVVQDTERTSKASVHTLAAATPAQASPDKPGGPVPGLTSCSPGKPAGVRKMQAGREEVGLPWGPYHLHQPHCFAAAYSSNGWRFLFVTSLWCIF
jgi:hypothetical protein